MSTACCKCVSVKWPQREKGVEGLVGLVVLKNICQNVPFFGRAASSHDALISSCSTPLSRST